MLFCHVNQAINTPYQHTCACISCLKTCLYGLVQPEIDK